MSIDALIEDILDTCLVVPPSTPEIESSMNSVLIVGVR